MTRLSSDEPTIVASQPKLDQNIMLFVRLLRRIGLSVGPASMLDAVEAALLVGIHNRSLFYHALASCLIKCPEDQALFKQAFNLFWQNPKFMERVRDLLLPQIKVPGIDIDDREDMLRRLSDALADPPQAKEGDDTKIEIDASTTASERAVSQTKDFAMMSGDELQAALSAIKKLAPYMPQRQSRRWQQCNSGGRWRFVPRCDGQPARWSGVAKISITQDQSAPGGYFMRCVWVNGAI